MNSTCPYDARGHNESMMQGPRGGIYWLCNRCGHIRRPTRKKRMDGHRREQP